MAYLQELCKVFQVLDGCDDIHVPAALAMNASCTLNMQPYDCLICIWWFDAFCYICRLCPLQALPDKWNTDFIGHVMLRCCNHLVQPGKAKLSILLLLQLPCIVTPCKCYAQCNHQAEICSCQCVASVDGITTCPVHTAFMVTVYFHVQIAAF